MNCLLIMSMTGSALFLLLAAAELIQPEIFSRKYRYGILKVVLILFIVPLPLILEYVRDLMLEMDICEGGSFVYKGTEPLILYAEGEIYKNMAYQVDVLVRNICFGIAAVSFLYHVRQYLLAKKQIRNTFQLCQDAEILNLLQTQKEDMKICRKVCIYTADFMISPFTIGIFKPIIVVPHFTDRSQLEMAVCHELCHIKSFDGFVRFLYQVLQDLYWYQPVVCFIGDYLNQASELACDEQATEHLDKDGRKRYSDLLIHIASEDFMDTNGCMDSLRGNKQAVKERIYYIMKGNRKISVFSAVLSVMMFICSTSTVFAYKPVNIMNESMSLEKSFAPIEKDTTIIISVDRDSPLFYDVGQDMVVYDLQLKTEDGTIYEITRDADARKTCKHIYEIGELQEHVKNTNGGCVVKIYLAKVCRRCGAESQKTLKNSISYLECLH